MYHDQVLEDYSPSIKGAEQAGGAREHLKRRARVQKNSKYDESSFLVDYSGNRNKFMKSDDLDLK